MGTGGCGEELGVSEGSWRGWVVPGPGGVVGRVWDALAEGAHGVCAPAPGSGRFLVGGTPIRLGGEVGGLGRGDWGAQGPQGRG